MRTVQHTIPQEIKGVIAFTAIMWGVFWLEHVEALRLTSYGLIPRTLHGLIGIPAMPFLHADWQHIVGNTLPLVVLLALLAGSRARSWEVVVEVVLLGGLLLWLFGRSAVHIGASGLIFGLIAFLIVSGLLERRFVPLVTSVVVAFLFGGNLLWGVVPQFGTHISWEGHLCNAIAGGVIAFLLTKRQKSQGSTIKTDGPPGAIHHIRRPSGHSSCEVLPYSCR